MQRLFSMFPGGAPGIALIILRLCAGGSLLVNAFTHGYLVVVSWSMMGVAAILLLLGAGALTPIACGTGMLLETFNLPHGVGLDLWQTASGMLILLVVALLGPGAFSLDAKLFGRRLIVPHPD